MSGLVAAVVTPMDDRGDLNLGIVPQIVDHLESNGITGIYIAGSTGEGMSLTDEERRAVAEVYVGAAKGRLKTFVQVGHNSLRASAELAGHAEAIGHHRRIQLKRNRTEFDQTGISSDKTRRRNS